MVEIIIKDGYEEYDIKGTRNCSFFKVKSKARIFAWESNGNQLIGYVAGRAIKGSDLHLVPYESLLGHLRKGTFSKSLVISEMQQYLQLFGSGVYHIFTGTSTCDYEIIIPGVNEVGDYQRQLGLQNNRLWIGSSTIIYAIQNLLDEDKIQRFIIEINNGSRPQILITNTYESEIYFLLYGYNIFVAYRRLNIQPVVVQITKTSQFYVDREQLKNVFSRVVNDDEVDLQNEFDNFIGFELLS